MDHEETRLINKKLKARRQNNVIQLATCCNKLGAHYLLIGQYEESLDNFKEELSLYNKGKDEIQIARVHRMIGDVCLQMNELTEAERHIQKFLNTSIKLNSKIDEERAFTTLGRLKLAQAEQTNDNENKLKLLADAKESFYIALNICKELPDVSNNEIMDMEARLYINIGLAEDYGNNSVAVLRNFEKALDIGQRHNLKDVCYLSHFNMALAYKNDLKRSYLCASLAADVAEKFENNSTKLVEVLLLKATICIKMEKYENAKKNLKKAYRLKTKDADLCAKIEKKLKIVIVIIQTQRILKSLEDTTNYGKILKLNEKLGDASCCLKNFEPAIIYYTRSLCAAEQCGDENLSPLYVSLYNTYKDLKQYDKAVEFMEKELELNKNNSMEAVKTLLDMADVHRESIGDQSNNYLPDSKFWQIDGILDRAQNEATKSSDTKLLKEIFLRKIEIRKFFKKHTLADIVKCEASMMNIDVDTIEPNSEEYSEEYDSEPKNVPQIGDEITLDDLSSDSSDNNNSDCENNAATIGNFGSAVKKRPNRSTYKIKKNEKGETPLHRYCIDGNYEQVQRLIKLGHPINVHDHFGWLPLHEACNHGHVEIVQLLLKHKAAINDVKNQDKISALHDACANGQLSVIEVLLDAGADVTLLNKYGQTAFELLKKIWRQSQSDITETDRFMYEKIYNQFSEKLNQNGSTINKLIDDDEDSIDYVDHLYNNDTISSQAGPSNIQSHRNILIDSDDVESSSDSHDSYNYNQSSYNVLSDLPAAVNEYQNVMNDMRSNKKSKFLNVQKENVKRPAFLDQNEVGENWLDNDLLPSAAKRPKIQSPLKKLSNSSYNSDYQPSTTTFLPEKPVSIIIDNDDDDNESSNENAYVDAYDILMGSSNSSDGFSSKSRRNRSTATKKRVPMKHQQNTLDSHVIQTNNLSSENIVSSSSSLPVQEWKQHQQSPQKQISSKMSLIKVKIEGHVLCVPIVNEMIDNLNVGWLADEAARRYYNLKGIKPILRLCTGTDEKAIFEDTDPIAILLSETSIGSIVLDWNLPLLSQRYVECCIQLKQDIDPRISGLIPIVQATQKLVITKQYLKSHCCKPLFNALNQQHLLTIINLANNFIEDEGIKYLVQSLPSLKQLKELDLSGNMISCIGIRYLNDMTKNQQQILPELMRLSLNYNMLGNESVPLLGEFCQSLTKLQTLELCSTDITNISHYEINLRKLTSFDISFNKFTTNELGEILKKINFSIMQNLNISFCVDKNNNNVLVGDLISLSMNSGTCHNLEKINLSGLHLTDGDAYKIIDSIKRSTKLKEINFNDNLELSSIALQLLLERVAVDNLYLENCRVLQNLSMFSIESFNVNDFIYAKNIFFTIFLNELNSLKQLFYRLYKKRCTFKLSQKMNLHVEIASPSYTTS